MQENSSSQEKKEVMKVKGSYFEVPGTPISNVKEESGMKRAQGSFFEVPGVPKSDLKEESGMESEGKVEEKKTSGNSAPFERKEPKESDFTAPGEIEAGYTEKSWAKPEKSMEYKAAERTEEVRPETVEETIERKDMEARERETGERETGERETGQKETRDREARDRETRDREAREREDQEAREREAREAREGKRTIYTMEKRLMKSKTDRKLFGVCGGLGEYFGIDPTLVRLAFVLLGLLHGTGLILYIVLAIIMPSEKNVEMFPSYRK